MHMRVAQRRADRGEGLGVRAGAKAVVERLERQTLLLCLALGPFVAVKPQPHRIGRVGVGLDKRRAPLPITDVEVVVVDEHRLATELEVRVRVVATLAPATPRIRLLLSDADQHHAEASLPLGRLEIRPGDVLLALVALEAHDGELVVQRELIDRLHIGAADAPQNRRRRDRATRASVQKRHQLTGTTATWAHSPPRTSGPPNAPAASHDRRVGS
jgi:hypothetical protein